MQLNRIMKDMADAGCEYVFMEVSSHALAQKRVAGLTFAGGIFSNITHDHLDYHKTFDEYLKAKKLFFDNLPEGSFSPVSTRMTGMARVMVQNTKSCGSLLWDPVHGRISRPVLWKAILTERCSILTIMSYGPGSSANSMHITFWQFILQPFCLDRIRKRCSGCISSLDTVEGRFQYLQSAKVLQPVIDYAHTPDAILNVLKTIDQIRKGNEQVITVIGAGGNRDKTKRPVMARVAAGMSDKLILTADNPRDEEPLDIINDMKAGLDEQLLDNTIIQPDRREAIKNSLHAGQQGRYHSDRRERT